MFELEVDLSSSSMDSFTMIFEMAASSSDICDSDLQGGILITAVLLCSGSDRLILISGAVSLEELLLLSKVTIFLDETLWREPAALSSGPVEEEDVADFTLGGGA